jgi:hypothetical protein
LHRASGAYGIGDATRIFGYEQNGGEQEVVEFVAQSAARALAIPGRLELPTYGLGNRFRCNDFNGSEAPRCRCVARVRDRTKRSDAVSVPFRGAIGIRRDLEEIGLLRRKDAERSIHGPADLFEATTDADRQGRVAAGPMNKKVDEADGIFT